MTGLEACRLGVRLGGRDVLADVDAVFPRGIVVAVVGPNGAGKSTLLGALAGLHRPARGAVRLDGVDLARMGDAARARRIGFLPQTAEIAWRLEVEALVGLGRIPHARGAGPSSADRAAVARAITATGLTAFAHRDVTTLSGGERARALIARALAGEPDHLVADEPLAALDPRHQLEVAALLRAFAQAGGGVVLTLHDLTLAARLADRVIVLSQGRVLADTPTEALDLDVLTTAFEVAWRRIVTPSGPRLEVAS